MLLTMISSTDNGSSERVIVVTFSVSVGFNCVSLTRISSTDNGSSERVIVVTFNVSSGRHSVERQQNTSEIPESV